VLVLLGVVCGARASCKRVSWWESFDKQGLSRCSSDSDYIRGFFRSGRGHPDKIGRLEEAKCCTADSPYTSDTPQVLYADWWKSLNKKNHWSLCPYGFFLQGLYRTKGNYLHNIEEGRCAKPASHPWRWGGCYDKDVSKSFDVAGQNDCNDGFFIAGFYRGGCDELHCIETFKCCKMLPQPDPVEDLATAKTKVMDSSLKDLATLAYNMGYGWCRGCRGEANGEDFSRNGDTFEAVVSKTRCEGDKKKERLNIKYSDWKFTTLTIKYGEPEIEDLTPDTIDSGVVDTRCVPAPVTHKVSKSIKSVRTVTHTVANNWKTDLGVDLTVSYKPPSVTGGMSYSGTFKFNYEWGKTTTNSEGKTDEKTFSVDQTTTVPVGKVLNWKLVLRKVRRTVGYTATVLIHFSVELTGFMRYGGGPLGSDTNFHEEQHGSKSKKTIDYKFGDHEKTFFADLKDQSEHLRHPWMWYEMKARYPQTETLINELADDSRYTFHLSGKFEDVSGNDLTLVYEDVTPEPEVPLVISEVEEGNGAAVLVAEAQPHDPPSPQVEYPQPDTRVENAARFIWPRLDARRKVGLKDVPRFSIVGKSFLDRLLN